MYDPYLCSNAYSLRDSSSAGQVVLFLRSSSNSPHSHVPLKRKTGTSKYQLPITSVLENWGRFIDQSFLFFSDEEGDGEGRGFGTGCSIMNVGGELWRVTVFKSEVPNRPRGGGVNVDGGIMEL